MSRSSALLRTGLMVVCVAFSTALAHAQYRASIQGVVTDTQGAVVPGAVVTLTNQETSQTSQATTTDAGIYNFNALPPSKYTIIVEKSGFKKYTATDVQIISEQANSFAVQLQIGTAGETVNVSGDAVPLIDTETSNLSGTVNAEQIQKLPSFGRDVFQLLQLAPGAFGDGAQAAGGGTSNLPGTTIGGTGGTDGVFKIENGGQITANGARTGENNYQIDGVGTTSVTWGGSSVITPNEESVKEVKILTDNYDAENGRYRGAQVQVISQNGTNQYHGSLFLKVHRPGLDAFTRYNGYAQNNTRDENRFNDYGGSVGGPIWKNKIFAFFSMERLSNNAQQASSGGWYETDALRAAAAGGTNAATFLTFPGVVPNGGSQTDSLNGQTLDCGFIGLVQGTNCQYIPGSGLDLGSPLTTGVGTPDHNGGAFDPGTGGDGSGGPQNLDGIADVAFIQGTLQPNNSSHVQYNGRLDVNVTSKDLVAFSIYYVPNTSTGINGNGDRLMNLFNTNYVNRAETLLWDHTFSPSLINEFRVNAAGWLEKDLDANPKAPWGLPQVSFNAIGNTTFQGYGIGSFNGFDQWTYAVKDVLTKVHGAHTMKMGGEFTRLLSVDAPFWADRPGYTFNNLWDFLNDAPLSESAQFDPQTGVPSALRKDLRSDVVGLFFQDNWKLRSNLTLNLGLRWEYFGPISEKHDKLATVVLGSGNNMFTDMHVRTGGNLYDAQKGNFGPQAGFAWSPGSLVGHEFNSRLVVRGGFGIAYNGLVQSNSLDGRFNPPFVDNGQSLICPNGEGTPGCTLTYRGTFPADVNNPNGYASNPNAILTFGPNNLPLGVCPASCVDLTAFAAKWPTTYDYHYTLGAEYDLGHQWVASVGYQGSQTRHLTDHYNLYNPASVLGIPFNPVVHGVTLYADDGNAKFNALLLEAKHNFSKSFLIDSQYRFSHTVDSGSNAYAGPFYQWNLAEGYATADYDARQAFKLFGVYSPTIFHGSRSWMEKVLGGWTISGILNMHSGFPFTPQYSYAELADPVIPGYSGADPVFSFNPSASNSGGSSSDAGTTTVLPVTYSGGFTPHFRSNADTVNGASLFTPPSVLAGTLFQCLFPNPDPIDCPQGQQALGPVPNLPGIARNSFRGPGYFDVDATLSKSFGLPNMPVLGENARLEIRANFFNLFNKLNLTNPQTHIVDGHFGEAQGALGARTIEMQARFSF